MRFIVSAIVTFFLFLISAPFILAATISLSGGQSSITANDEYKVSVKLSIDNDSKYYLRGVFHKPNTSGYCGYTWNKSSWFSGPYSSNNGWTNFLSVTTQNNLWIGELKVKFNPTVNECSGGGTYNFKIERFTQSGSSQFDTQNEQTVQVTIATPTLTSIVSPAPSLSQTVSDPASPTTTESVPTPTIFEPTPTTDSTINNSDPTSTLPSATAAPQMNATPVPTGNNFSTASDSDTTTTDVSASNESVLGLQVEPTSSGLSNDPQSLPAKAGISSGVWYLLFMGGILLMAGCGIVLFQIRRKK